MKHGGHLVIPRSGPEGLEGLTRANRKECLEEWTMEYGLWTRFKRRAPVSILKYSISPFFSFFTKE